MRNDSGKALTIFLILISVIFVSLTAISVFLLVKQVQLRESAEEHVAQLQTSEGLLRVELQDVKKQNELLDQKTKEAENQIESLLEELDLAQSVRDEVRKENRELKESLETMKKTTESLKAQFEQKEQDVNQRIGDLQSQLDAALDRNKTLEERRLELEKEYGELKEKLTSLEQEPELSDEISESVDVDLGPIIVSSTDAMEGRIVSVDQEAEFVIVNLGERHGVAVDQELAVYNGNKHLGNVKATRVLPEMSAADFVPPLTSQDISEGDFVKLK